MFSLDKNFLVEEATHLPNAEFKMSRADVARFILDQVNSQQYTRKLIAIGTKPL